MSTDVIESAIAGAHLSPRERAIAAALLALGPFRWPREPGQRSALAARLGVASPPAAAIGATLLVAADDDDAGGSVLLLATTTAPTPTALRAAEVTFGAAARAAWRDAHAAAAAGVPLRFRSLDALADGPGSALRVGRHRDAGAPHRDGAVQVDGPSFGLGFFVHLAATAAELRVRADVVALAALSPDGALLPVGSLPAKLAVVKARLPGVTRVVVAPEQADLVHAAGLLAVTPRNAAAALDEVLDGGLDDAIAAAAGDAARRDEWVAALLRLALDGHGRVSHWPPIAAAADAAARAFAVARPHLSPLDGDGAADLAIARAIATRHAKRATSWPGLDDLDRFPLAVRLLVLAHAVQHAADVGSPAPATLAPIVEPLLATPDAYFDAHCRLAGAWARLLAVRGEAERAFALQTRVAHHRLAIYEERGASQPICEALRLAGVLGTAAAANAATALDRRGETLGAFGARDRPYLELYRAAAAAGRADAPDHHQAACERFAAVVADRLAPAHVRLSAARRWLRLEPGAAPAHAALMATDTPPPYRGHQRLFAALAQLDAALAAATVAADRDSTLRAALEAIEAEMPGPLHHLRTPLGDADAGSVDAFAAAVARHFPY